MPRIIRVIVVIREEFEAMSNGSYPFLITEGREDPRGFVAGDRIDIFSDKFEPSMTAPTLHIHRWVTGVQAIHPGLKSGYVVLGLTDEPQGEDA